MINPSRKRRRKEQQAANATVGAARLQVLQQHVAAGALGSGRNPSGHAGSWGTPLWEPPHGVVVRPCAPQHPPRPCASPPPRPPDTRAADISRAPALAELPRSHPEETKKKKKKKQKVTRRLVLTDPNPLKQTAPAAAAPSGISSPLAAAPRAPAGISPWLLQVTKPPSRRSPGTAGWKSRLTLRPKHPEGPRRGPAAPVSSPPALVVSFAPSGGPGAPLLPGCSAWGKRGLDVPISLSMSYRSTTETGELPRLAAGG